MNDSFETNAFIANAISCVGNTIHLVYQQGYANGLKDGKESVQIEADYINADQKAIKEIFDDSTAYNRGLEDAWELARRLPKLGFNETRKAIFGMKYGLSIDIIKDFTVDEVMEKIKDMPIECDILHDTCPYPEKKCPDCNLHKAFQEAKDKGGTHERKTES